jgi:hypothetical protein
VVFCLGGAKRGDAISAFVRIKPLRGHTALAIPVVLVSRRPVARPGPLTYAASTKDDVTYGLGNLLSSNRNVGSNSGIGSGSSLKHRRSSPFTSAAMMASSKPGAARSRTKSSVTRVVAAGTSGLRWRSGSGWSGGCHRRGHGDRADEDG